MLLIPFAITTIESEDDRAVMTDIYLRNRALMLKIAWDYTRVPSEVDDIVSDTCVMLIQHLDRLKEMNAAQQRSYITASLKHKAIDACRKKLRKQKRSTDIDTDQLEPPVSFERRIALQDEIDMVKTVLRSLPKRERETLTMKFFERKSDGEIAAALGIAESSVRRYVMRGRNHLKAALYEEEDQP